MAAASIRPTAPGWRPAASGWPACASAPPPWGPWPSRAAPATAPPWPSPSPARSFPMPDRIRVLIVDDHKVVRVGLATMIGRERDMEVVAEAADGPAALAAYAAHRPDVVLLD